MNTVTLIGIDLGKHGFHLHGQDATGRMVFRKKCSRQRLREAERGQRLPELPGIGPITASVLMTEPGDARQVGSARQFAASAGLAPRQYSTGGTPTLLGISKRGGKNLRRLLVQGARAVMQRIGRRTDRLGIRGARAAGKASLECGGLRAGQQIGEDSLGHPRQRNARPK